MSNRRFLFSGSGHGERLKFYPNMKAIIAEKQSVGMDIARVVGATEKKSRYCTGNGYMVTWASGHLVSLALPDTYGYTKAVAEDLPMMPHPFRLVSRQIRTDRGMVTDIAASRQLKVIDEVFSKCDDTSWQRMQAVKGNLSSGGYMPIWVIPSRSDGCGSPRSRTRPSAKAWQTSRTEAVMTVSMPQRTAGQRRTGWWA